MGIFTTPTMSMLDWPRWVVMWAMAGALFCGCKCLTWYCARRENVPFWRQFAYFALWPGLDAEAFLGTNAKPRINRPKVAEWLMALCCLALGIGLFWGVARMVPESSPLRRGWTGMAAFIFIAHCGIFHLLSCAWRSVGVDARPLMAWPLRAQGLGEFWGRRWNTAFRDFAGKFLFQPLTRRLGPRRALLAGFIFSGAVHELAVTVPAGGGYGGPTFFFTLQGAAILCEKSPTGRKLGLGQGVRGWIFTVLILIIPAGIAFPPVFVHNVILPMMHAAGAF